MGRKAQVWVHPNLRFMGGSYDHGTGRAVPGGPWPDRVEQSIDDHDGDSIAITTAKYDEGSDHFPDTNGPRVDIPYAREKWDQVVADADYGDLRDAHPFLLRDWAETYDHITVRGGYLDDCLQTFVETYRSVDPDTPVTVDPDFSYLRRGTGLVPVDEVDRIDWEERRARVAERASDEPYEVSKVRGELEELDGVTVAEPGVRTVR